MFYPPPATKKRILIYRLGSMGDTLVALPALRLVARAYPDAKRIVLTNFSRSEKAAPMAEILEGTELVHEYIEYPLALRNKKAILTLIKKIRKYKFDTLIYLAASRGFFRIWRDVIFFHACGIHNMIGVPYTPNASDLDILPSGLYESHASMLARRVAALGDARPADVSSFALDLSAVEHSMARAFLEPLAGKKIIAISVGAKLDIKDWEDSRWHPMLEELAVRYPDYGLVALGSRDEAARCDVLCASWRDRFINACGLLSVRISAAVLNNCAIFIGHDSGPMHLSAAVGTPCVAIFSSHSYPGIWFPSGSGHQVLYHESNCQGLGAARCAAMGKACIRSITIEEVLNSVDTVLGAIE